MRKSTGRSLPADKPSLRFSHLQYQRHPASWGNGMQVTGLEREEALSLMALPLHSPETYALMAAADSLSRK